METQQEFRHLVRIADADLNGNKVVHSELRRINGVSYMLSNALCNITGVNKFTKVGYLTDTEINKIDEVLKDPEKFGIPQWLFNRRKDPEDGVSRHVISSTLKFITDNDIKNMRRIKSYRGVRHSLALPVRGQRTRSNFRKNKGKVHLGVKKREGVKGGRV